MSYTRTNSKPSRLKFSCNPSGLIELTFICPRCDNENHHTIEPKDLTTDFEVTCYHQACAKPDERFGYKLEFYSSWYETVLGLNDRPLST